MANTKPIIYLLLPICFILGFITSKVSNNNLITFKEIRDNQGYKFINPLLECDFESISKDKNLNQLKDNIDFIINEQKKTKNISFVSVYYRDLNNGPWFGINEKEYFSPASLIKVPLMIAYYKNAENDPSILNKEVEITEDYNPEEQNFAPTKFLELNKIYTVDELINQMIIYSDNNAYKFLLQNIDNSLVYKVYQDLGVNISKAKDDPSGNIITVKDYASFFRILFNSSYLNKNMSEKALNLLSQTTFKRALASGVPDNIIVSHKFGERRYLSTNERQLHDCGIIYSPNKPYLICIMTRGNDFDNLINVVSQISKTIYSEINK